MKNFTKNNFHKNFKLHMQETDRTSRKVVNVWGICTRNGLGPLVRIRGRNTAANYRQIIEFDAIPYIVATDLQDNYYFLQDHASIHTAHVAMDFLNEVFPDRVFPWAPRSPGMNVIEHVWAFIKHKLSRINASPANDDELWEMIRREWDELGANHDFIEALFDSMPRRVENLINVQGGPTKY